MSDGDGAISQFRDGENFLDATHFTVDGVPEPDPVTGKYPNVESQEDFWTVEATIQFKMFGRPQQAADFVDRLQRRLRVEVDATATVVNATFDRNS